jgi:hypothetical protein
MQQELGEARHAQRKRGLAARRAVRRVTCTITARDEARIRIRYFMKKNLIRGYVLLLKNQ